MASKKELADEIAALRRDIQTLRTEVDILRRRGATYTINVPQTEPRQWWQPGGGITCTAVRTEGNPAGPGRLAD
jgi:hypothetical protein